MLKKIIGIIICMLMFTSMILPFCNAGSLKKSSNIFYSDDENKLIQDEIQIINTIVNQNRAIKTNPPQVFTDDEIVFTSPYDYDLEGTESFYDPYDWDKWYGDADADKSTGICKVLTVCNGAASGGWIWAAAGVAGIFTATEDLTGVKLHLYCSAKFLIHCGNTWNGYSEFKIIYTYYEDNVLISDDILKQWKRTSGTEEYNVDYTNNPLTHNLPKIKAGRTYKIWAWAFAKTESNGGGDSLVDCYSIGFNRWMEITKIKITAYPPAGWLEISPSSYDYGEVDVGDYEDHTFKVTNVHENYSVHNIESKILWGDDFSVVKGSHKDYLAPGASYDVVVRFRPEYWGSRKGELISGGDHTNTARASLRGTGKNARFHFLNFITIFEKFPNLLPILRLLLQQLGLQ